MGNKYYQQQIDALLKEGYQIEFDTNSGTTLRKPIKFKWLTCFIFSPILIVIWTSLMGIVFGWLAAILGFTSSLGFCIFIIMRDIAKQKAKNVFVSKLKP